MPENYYPFEVKPLPYAYDALEPAINEETMRVHHDRLLKGYVDRLNTVLTAYPRLQRLSLEQMLENPWIIPVSAKVPVMRFGGGVFNHNFFFASLRPANPQNKAVGSLKRAIDRKFGSFEAFRAAFKGEAMAVFGSGWLWLVKDDDNELSLVTTANQDTPISAGYVPLITIDIWEHAYFLQYLNLRDEYIDNWFQVIDWNRAESLYAGT